MIALTPTRELKLALALIVKGDDKEAVALARCLKFVAPHVDKIFITLTQENEQVRNVAKAWNAEVSFFPWVNDFSKARNFNFAQVPKEYDYILWLDSDDALRGGELLKSTIEKHLDVDVFSLNYLYAFDEDKNPIVVHQKSRIIKNDGCVEWVGALHEDFKENRTLQRYFIKDIEVLHLTDVERIGIAKKRNVEVAEQAMKEKPDDPRSYWNLGNALKSDGRNEEALDILEKFLTLSDSDEEKYIVHMRLAEIYLGLGDKHKAIDRARYAIGIRPEYPDAYHLSGHIFRAMGNLQRARDSFLFGLTKKPPYYSIIVYNPRDYDAVPLKALAKVYFELSMPIQALECLKGVAKIYPDDEGLKSGIKKLKKEADKFEKVLKHIQKLRKITDKDKLKKELDKIPKEIQSHPAICNIRNIHFVKQESSGRDLVYYCGYTSNEWNPEVAEKKGIGGSEEAVIHLTQRWAEEGWNVTVYNNIGHQEKKFGKVTYKPYWSWNYRDKQDVVILWRSPMAANHEINAPKIFLDLHDILNPGEFTEERLKRIDKIFVKSEFHKSLYPKVPQDKLIVIPNGLDAVVYSQEMERDPYLLINTSSPDRSLNILLDLFKRVREKVPQVKLKWAYGWDVFDVVHGDNLKPMKWKEGVLEKMKNTPGVENLGKISHEEVAKLYMTANIFAYPTDFAEIHCISAAKAQAGGAIPVTTDFAALDETVRYGFKIHSTKTKDTWCGDYQFDFGLEDEEAQNEWVHTVITILENPIFRIESGTKMRRWARETFDWDKLSPEWSKYFS